MVSKILFKEFERMFQKMFWMDYRPELQNGDRNNINTSCLKHLIMIVMVS